MQGQRQRAAWGADGARLVVLSLLLAGFLSMHGFLAVSAAADAHLLAPTTAHVHATAAPAHGAPVDDGPAEPVGGHAPPQHHGVLAGCVVALVGVALLTLGVVSSLRRRPLLLDRVDRRVASLRGVATAGQVGWASPRIALCVIRV